MVRVNHRKLIDLQRNALRAAELEAANAELDRGSALLEAQARASELLEERWESVRAEVDPVVRAEVLDDLPLTADGRLHETAFLALVEARVWARREQDLFAITSPNI